LGKGGSLPLGSKSGWKHSAPTRGGCKERAHHEKVSKKIRKKHAKKKKQKKFAILVLPRSVTHCIGPYQKTTCERKTGRVRGRGEARKKNARGEGVGISSTDLSISLMTPSKPE